MTWRQGGAYALLGPVRLRQDHAAQLISGIVTPSRGKILFDGTRRHAAVDPEAQHRAGVPVPGDLRHHDGRRESRLPAARTAACRSAEIDARVAEIAQLLDLTPYLDRKATRLTADAKQKISLGRGLVRSDVAADPVRRAADGDRSAPEMGAALEAQGAAPRSSTSR